MRNRGTLAVVSLDSGADNGQAYARLFSADGAFVRANGELVTGREALAATAQRVMKGPLGISHLIVNHVIEPTADGAIGKQYVIVIDHHTDGKPSTIFLGGQYQDEYVKTPQGWRFKTRTEFRSQYTTQAEP